MYDSPTRSSHTRSRDPTTTRRGLVATALIAAALVAGIVLVSLGPVSIVLLGGGALVAVAARKLLPDLREFVPTEVNYRVPGLDLDVEIAVSTAE